jgi:hypothetical protein
MNFAGIRRIAGETGRLCASAQVRHVLEMAVKPSAQPTLVRTQHLPPSAETARGLGFVRAGGRSCVVSSSVICGQERSLRHAGYGHMADSVRPGGTVRRTACSGLPGVSVRGEVPGSRESGGGQEAAGTGRQPRRLLLAAAGIAVFAGGPWHQERAALPEPADPRARVPPQRLRACSR